MLKDHSYTCFQGGKIKKSEKIFELLGELDKLNTSLGMARAFSRKKSLKRRLFFLQEEILEAGSLIALNKDLKEFRKKATLLEKEIEKIKDPKLKEFVKPGKTKSEVFLHFARVVCREAERKAVALEKKNYLPLVEFLNRLSLFLFWLGVKETSVFVQTP